MTKVRTTSASLKPALAIAALGATLAVAIAVASFAAKPASAYDDDVEVVCWDGYNDEIECMEVGDLAAECALADPEYTTEQCGGLLESRVPANVRVLKRKSKPAGYTYDAQYGGKGSGQGRGDGGQSGSGNSNGGGNKGPND